MESDKDREKRHAHPWNMVWPKMNYFLLDSDEITKMRRLMFNRYSDLRGLTDNEIEPAFEKYLVPFPDRSKNPIHYNDPLADYINTPLPKEPRYIDLVNLNLEETDEILSFVNNHGLLGIIFNKYKYLSFSCGEGKEDENYYILDNLDFEFINENIGLNDKKNITIDAQTNHSIWFKEENNSLLPLTFKQINDIFFPIPPESDPFIPVEPPTLKPLVDRLIVDVAGFKNKIDLTINPLYYAELSWYSYAEPVELFIQEAKEFQKTYKAIAEYKLNDATDVQSDGNAMFISAQFTQKLKHINPEPKYTGGRNIHEHGWNVPSLLSAYYLMLFLYINQNRKARYCKFRKCQKAFIAERNDNMYCTARCQDAAKKDRKRHPEFY